ncbi:BTAD domain-containing putative transcriptional regulator [Nocardia sp. PE-7]|uniref:AfsR/SARP family transcriptional regulator n=1 Tax=Nocardia sp. PE-7 TaxID=3058426 RepID=UPI0026597CB6|nr:BTAD domain-containing putative transcriptional regulator [Nocardia sp. PE-7]WKG09089.1 BTAD domain-containing putative transcriptional regulator [Nocardia sp. PE-7]
MSANRKPDAALAYDDIGMSVQHRGPEGSLSEALSRVVVGVLGVIAIRRDEAMIALPGARARLLLAALAVHPGRARSAQALIDEVWGEQPPRAPMNALHTQVSRLRALLPDGALEIGPAGYRLTLPADSVDLTAVAALARRADEHLAAGNTADSLAAIALAHTLWRGEPGADLPDSAPADDLRAAAVDLRRHLDHTELAAHTARHDFAAALPLARAAATTNPLDESAHTTLVRLLAAAGRTNEALEVFATYRLRLIEELGADPGPALLALNTAVLRGETIEIPGDRAAQRNREADPSASPPAHRAADSSALGVNNGDIAGRRGPTDARSSAVAARYEGAEADLPDSTSGGGSQRSGASPIVELDERGQPNTQPAESANGSAPDRSTANHAATPRTAVGLRAAPNELLGRTADLDAIIELAHRSRVTTVLGPGGTGKTRVANAVGERLARSVPVVLVELASVQPESEVGADSRTGIEVVIGQVMGLGEVIRDPGAIRQGRQIDARTRLREALAARPMVLILDNCEHVIDAAAEVVADLVGRCAQLTVLTTSRSPLAITAESVYPLAPLAIDAAGSPATELFSARARAVRPDVRLDPDTVARLCRTLDGLPLAIELAAARVRTMSVAEIETRLEHRFALLRSGDRSAPHRHRTLHAVIAWSWNLLDLDQQVTLRRLSRFAAGFTLSAAEIVAAGPDVAAAVDGLVGQSLLTVLDDPDGAGIRYRMLETVREFGAEQIAAADAATDGAESALVLDRMFCWAREFALASFRGYRGGDQVRAVLAVTADLDNLVAVLRIAVDRADAHTAYSVFPVVAMVWVMRGAHLEFTGWAMRLVALVPPPPASGDAADLQMIAHLLTCLHMLFLKDGGVRATAIVRTRARRLVTNPDLDPGLSFLGTVITVRPEEFRLGRLFARGARSHHRQVRVAALIARANLWENAGNVAGSTRDSLRTLDDMDPAEVWGMATVSQHLAQLSGQSAHYADAVNYYRRALELMGKLRVHEEIMESRCYLAASLVGCGRLEQARAELDFALRPDDSGVSAVDDPTVRRNHRLANAATALAELELAEGDIDAGLRHFRRGLELLGWPDFEPTPGPGSLMIAAGTVSAHVLHGRASVARALVAEMIETADQRLAQYIDLPQIGAVACALGSYLLTTENGRTDGLELLTLAGTSMARQDSPSMELAAHIALHRSVVGDAAMDAALHRAAGTRRLDAAMRVIEIIAGLH